jgi:hypothetical protein
MIRIKVTSTKIEESIYDHEYKTMREHIAGVYSYMIPRNIYDCFFVSVMRGEKDVEIRVAHTTYKLSVK